MAPKRRYQTSGIQDQEHKKLQSELNKESDISKKIEIVNKIIENLKKLEQKYSNNENKLKKIKRSMDHYTKTLPKLKSQLPKGIRIYSVDLNNKDKDTDIGIIAKLEDVFENDNNSIAKVYLIQNIQNFDKFKDFYNTYQKKYNLNYFSFKNTCIISNKRPEFEYKFDFKNIIEIDKNSDYYKKNFLNTTGQFNFNIGNNNNFGSINGIKLKTKSKNNRPPSSFIILNVNFPNIKTFLENNKNKLNIENLDTIIRKKQIEFIINNITKVINEPYVIAGNFDIASSVSGLLKDNIKIEEKNCTKFIYKLRSEIKPEFIDDKISEYDINIYEFSIEKYDRNFINYKKKETSFLDLNKIIMKKINKKSKKNKKIELKEVLRITSTDKLNGT